MPLTIEIATPASSSGILELQEKFYAIDHYPYHPETARQVLLRFLEAPGLGRMWTLGLEEKLIGYIALTFSYSFEFGGKIAFLDEFYIEESYRSRGFGSEALSFVLKEARMIGLQVLHLEAERHNLFGKAIYHKFGFKDHDRHLMTKLL